MNHTIVASLIVGYFVASTLITTGMMGKERKPLSPSDAVLTTIFNSVLILGVAYLAGWLR